MTGLAAHQDAAHRARVADVRGELTSGFLRRRQIGKVGAMTLAGVDDGQPRGARLFEQGSSWSDCLPQQRNVVAECLAKPPGLEKVALHVDDDEARPSRIEIERVGFRLDDRHDTPL